MAVHSNIILHNEIRGTSKALTETVQVFNLNFPAQNIQLTENDVLHIPLTAKITARTHSLLQEIVLADNSIQEKKLADLDEILLNLLELNHQPNTGERSHSQIPFGSTIFHPKVCILK